MVLVSENFALFFFVVILIVAAAIAWWMGSYSEYEPGKFHTFIVILAGLGVFVTFLFYYNVVALQNQQQQLAALEEIARINDSMTQGVLHNMQKASAIVPNFVLSLTPLNNTVCCFNGTITGTTGITGTITGSTGITGTIIATGTTGFSCTIPTVPDPITPIACTQKATLSYLIFDMWQAVITCNRIIKFDTIGYVSTFLQQANSSQLYAQWQVSYISFDSKTQTFGNLLFQYGLPITVQTPQSYLDAANQLISNPSFQALLS